MPTFLILMCGLTLESVYPRARIGGARALKVVERYSTSVCSTTLPTFHSLHISACLASHLSLSLICPFTHPLLLTYVFLFMFPSYCLYFWFNSAVIRLHSKSKLTLCIAITVHFPATFGAFVAICFVQIWYGFFGTLLLGVLVHRLRL